MENVKDVSNYISRIDEMIERKTDSNSYLAVEDVEVTFWTQYKDSSRFTAEDPEIDLASELHHGMLASNLSYAVAEEMDCHMNSAMSLR